MPSRRRHSASSSLRLVSLRLLALLTLPLLFACNAGERLVYMPDRDPFPNPRGVEDVTFASADGVELHAWLFSADVTPAPGVLYLHGTAANIALHEPVARFIRDEGYSVLAVDYRGYGRSEDAEITRDGLLLDTRAAYAALLDRPEVDTGSLAVVGFSLGGVYALALAAEEPEIDAVTTIATFSSWKAMANRFLPAGSLIVRRGLDQYRSVERLAGRPLLIMHGSSDWVVPFDHALRLYDHAEHAGVDVEFHEVVGGDHNHMFYENPDMSRELGRFLRRHLGGFRPLAGPARPAPPETPTADAGAAAPASP